MKPNLANLLIRQRSGTCVEVARRSRRPPLWATQTGSHLRFDARAGPTFVFAYSRRDALCTTTENATFESRGCQSSHFDVEDLDETFPSSQQLIRGHITGSQTTAAMTMVRPRSYSASARARLDIAIAARYVSRGRVCGSGAQRHEHAVELREQAGVSAERALASGDQRGDVPFAS